MSGKQEQNALHGKTKLSGGAPTLSLVSDRTMDDGTLDQLSALLRFGCSVKLACKEVHNAFRHLIKNETFVSFIS